MRKKEKIHLCSLQRDYSGLTVISKIGNFRYTIFSVPENIILCAIGADDMAYLLGEQVNSDFQEGDDPEDEFISPGRTEEQCFCLLPTHFKDCMKHGYPKLDYWSGSMHAEFVP